MELINTVSAVIRNKDGKILFEDHIKCAGFALPGGKVSDNDISLAEALIRELYEELGIIVSSNNCIHLYSKLFQNSEYPVGSNNHVNFLAHVYLIDNYTGEIINKEPDKHKSIEFLSLSDLKEAKRTEITDSLILYMLNKSPLLKN